MIVSILFNSTLIGIQSCKILQLQNFKTRLGGEICSSDVNMHKDNCRSSKIEMLDMGFESRIYLHISLGLCL